MREERGERLKIEAAGCGGGGGGIIVIGGAFVAAAVGAAFAAHRARGRARGNRNRGAIDENKEVEKGLQSLLPSTEENEEEDAFDSSVEIQETGEIHGSCKIPEMITEIKGSEMEAGIYKIGPVDGDVTLEEFSFWNGKSTMPEIQSEQSLTELETTHLPEEQEKFCIEEDGVKKEEGSEVVEACSAELSEDAAWPTMRIEQEEKVISNNN